MRTPKQPLFGVAGNPPHFWESEFKNERANAPEWLSRIGLDALEIQCGRGVRMPDDRAALFRKNAAQFGIALSVHAPYYISLGTPDPGKIENSINEIRKSLSLAQRLGTNRVILHLGSVVGDREQSRARAIAALQRVESDCRAAEVTLYPEVIGKVKQLGSLEDIIEICAQVEQTRPCIDFAHLHARTGGSLRTREDFTAVLDAIQRRLGDDAFEEMHVHFYPIEWNDSGEVRHRAFEDTRAEPEQWALMPERLQDSVYLPRYEPFLEEIAARSLGPTIICEAKDSQDTGALKMKAYHAQVASQMISGGRSAPPETANRKLG